METRTRDINLRTMFEPYRLTSPQWVGDPPQKRLIHEGEFLLKRSDLLLECSYSFLLHAEFFPTGRPFCTESRNAFLSRRKFAFHLRDFVAFLSGLLVGF